MTSIEDGGLVNSFSSNFDKISESSMANHFFVNLPKAIPNTKIINAVDPNANIVSPGIRIQRNICTAPVSINSVLRAYQ